MNTENNKIITIDFSLLREGQIDPGLGKTIKTLIIHASDYIVYLDEDERVQWGVKEAVNTSHLGQISNEVSRLEFLSNFLADDPNKKNQLKQIRVLLGEAIARIVDGNDVEQATVVLKEAESLLAARNADTSFSWYFTSAFVLVFLMALFAFISWFIRQPIISAIGRNAYEVIFCAVFGGVGALVSVATRTNSIKLDAAAGKTVHRLEALARIFTGMIAAALLVFAVKAGLILKIVKDIGSPIAYLLFLSTCAGVSERIIPSFVKKLEQSITSAYINNKMPSEIDANGDEK